VEKLLTLDELKKVAAAARAKGIVKAKPVNIPKNDRYDRITIARQKTWERLGIWIDR